MNSLVSAVNLNLIYKVIKMTWFRGYVKTKGKKSIERFRNVENLRTIDDVKNLEEYAGVLAENTVLIDVDDKEQSELLVDILEKENVICQIRETTRGKHFFFLNNGSFKQCYTGIKLACGIKADIKVGLTNSYSVLKFNGVEREIIYDKFDNEEYMKVPHWLNVVNTTLDLFNLSEGEGRNNALFSYILNLQSAGLTKDQIKDTLRIINTNIFMKPLSDSEMETITRDEAFETAIIPSFYEDKKFLFNVFAEYLVKNLPIKKINGLLHVYEDGYYQDGIERIEREMIKLIPTLSRAKRNEVYEYIKLLVFDDNTPAPANYIAFNNGIYDIDSNSLLQFSPDILITNKIPYDYNPNAYFELLDKTLDKLACNDSSIRVSLEEMAGYTMYRRNELRKAFILIGDKANGKSTYLAIIQKMLGEDNVSALDLKELCERFKPAELYRKLANIGDDIADDFIPDTAIFKKLVSGDRITAERKGQDPFTFNNYSKMIFSANNMPRVKDKTGAVISRLIILPFKATFTKEDPDYRPFIKYELQEKESIEYMIKLGIDALKKVLERKEFTLGDQAKKQLEEYDELNNPIITFYAEYDADNMRREPINVIYSSYKEFCLVNNFTPISRIEFSRQTTKYFNFEIVRKTINGKCTKFFIDKKC